MNTAKQAGQNTRDLAQKIARQMAEEPLEILKDAGTQVAGVEAGKPQENYPQNQDSGDTAKITGQEGELADKAKSARRMEALNREIRDIHKQDLFNDLQRKISQGVDIPVADYSELSMEQKQVLKAQMEAYKNQSEKIQNESAFREIPVVRSRPSRRFGAGQKQEAEKQQTRVEKPVPPSG
ncbi:MAG: hypothetical protein UW20_C0004G0076 [Candidatus Woesebacteria bacterium GW2011_GWB1_44_11]|uniref:Uncharacterized protein n=1 Tax=Candidatus Woesebacteria bacterium GW2011_GWB1_44_11 TaxID=1618579 RepID=A0A837IAA3_9BACT|nr:MAG: hypothetical protein UW20_C0004G0076 [Candidatus Woesebacteria bacterium GW2011_GWB1_44_11]